MWLHASSSRLTAGDKVIQTRCSGRSRILGSCAFMIALLTEPYKKSKFVRKKSTFSIDFYNGNKMIKWILKKPYAALVFLIFSIVIITLSLSFNFLCKYIFPTSSAGIYNKDFWVNLLVNLNSSIIDFLFLGLVILYLIKKIKEKKNVRIAKD